MRRSYISAVLLAAAVLLVAGAAIRHPTTAAIADAGRWEYRQVTFHGDYTSLEQALAQAGLEGFELVLISPQETVAIFKRPAER